MFEFENVTWLWGVNSVKLILMADDQQSIPSTKWQLDSCDFINFLGLASLCRSTIERIYLRGLFLSENAVAAYMQHFRTIFLNYFAGRLFGRELGVYLRRKT